MRASRGISSDMSNRVTRNVQLRSSVSGAQLRNATLNSIPYIVVPCVSKLGDNVEWPVNAPTPEYIPGDVLRFTAESRNNRPVVMDHPQRSGEYVSANDPDIIEKYQYGHVFSARYEDKPVDAANGESAAATGQISCELWLDPARAKVVGSDAVRVIERLQAGETVEVSEGNVVVIEKREGIHNGKSYGAVWQLCFSDHVATLPEGTVGACAIADGCGALRSSTLRIVMDDELKVKVASLSQARRPTFTGTETIKWSKPTFADYVKYLHAEGDPPTSVSQCTAAMKTEIASHTLLGDPDATSFNDLSFFPVVNPSSGKLNENALRAVISGRGSLASSISESALKSAQDMARRLLNSEFGANLEASMVNENKKTGGLKRLLASMASKLRGAMSNNDLRYKLYQEIAEIDPRISYVVDEDVDTKTVIYCVVISFGDYYDYSKTEYHFYSRSFTVDASGTVTIADGDSVEVELSESWKPVSASEMAEEAMDGTMMSMSEDNSEAKPALVTAACACKGDHMATVKDDNKKSGSGGVDRASVLARLSAMTDEELVALEAIKPTETTTNAPVQATPATTTTTTTPSTTTASAAETVAISAAEYASIKAAADAFQRQQVAHKAALVTQISTAQGKDGAFTVNDLNAMDITLLAKLARSLKLEDSSTTTDYSVDYSLRGAPSSALASRAAATHAPPRSWDLALSREKAAKNGNGSNGGADKSAN